MIKIRFTLEADGKVFGKGCEIIENDDNFLSTVAESVSKLAMKCVETIAIERKVIKKDDVRAVSFNLMRHYAGGA